MKIGKVSDWTSATQKKIFGLIKLKPMQIAILNCNKEHDVIVNLPTGFGKSLLFQYPASRLVNKCVVVFVPLKALLWDCLKEAQLHNLTASELELKFIKEYQRDQKLPQLLFLTPERFFMNQAVYSFMDMLYYKKLISMVVIDEAHCISEWGSDFRPDYARLSELRTIFPEVKILAMSATIPPEARNDLVKKLQITGAYYFQSSSNRPNLIYEIQSAGAGKNQVPLKIVEYIKSKGLQQQSGIIYCQTIKNCEQVFQDLRQLKIDCCLFHSKLSEKVRSQNFQEFMQDRVRIIVATICFGMGVNKKNIRFVINAGVSLSAENYYQESGRAGRDGAISYCLLLTFNSDVAPLQFLISSSTKSTVLQKRRLFKLGQIKTYAKSQECRKKHLFKLLGEDFSVEDCQKTCDFCKRGGATDYTLQQLDYTSKALKMIEHMRCEKLSPTRRQLIDMLRGKKIGKKNKYYQQKCQFLIQLFKGEKTEIIESLVQSLLSLGLLCPVMTSMGTGQFKRMVQYLKPCNKSEVAKHKTIMVSVKHKKSVLEDNKLMKNFEFLPGNNRAGKFDKYLQKKVVKTASQQIDQFQFSTEPELAGTNPEDLKKSKAQAVVEDLKEIKMVKMGIDYQKFFQQILQPSWDNFQEKKQGYSASLQAIDVNQQGQYQNQEVDISGLEQQFGSDPQITMENAFTDEQKQQLSASGTEEQEQGEEESRVCEELMQRIKKMKREKEEEKKKERQRQEQNKAVVRKSLIDKYQFK